MKLSNILTLSLFSFAGSSFATIDITDNFSVSGFGSTSVTKSNNATPLFVHREITDNSCYDCDTTFGLQADWLITDDINASVQVVKRPQDNWSDPELEWAYLAYQDDNLTFKGGRLRIPLFLASEYYYVGQAYTWSRPPQEVYDSLLGFTFFDGLSARWQADISDDTAVTVSPYYGFERDNTTEVGPDKITFDTERVAGISMDVSGFNYRIHAGFMHTQFEMTPLMAPSIDKLNIYTLGVEYSLDDWLFMTEMQTDSTQTNWYLSGAYNIGDFTPYLVYGESHHRRKSNSLTAGVRYDITYSISLNAEWQGVYMTNENYEQFNTGQFVRPPKLVGEDKDVQLYTLMINFVF